MINILVLASAIGFDVPMGSIGSMISGIIFMILGNYLPHVRSNFFIGIRTPWTLSSDEVWKQTHRAASKIFFFGGFVLIIATFIPGYWKEAIFFIVIALTVIAPYIYSYVLFKRKR